VTNESSSEESESSLNCRICYEPDDRFNLLRPCACAGTSAYVHSACLRQWMGTSANPEDRNSCAQCFTR
jgi:E3 ubiquitin-protein ligase DOA10